MFLLTPEYTAKDLIQNILEKFEIKDIINHLQYFALFESRNGTAINGSLALDDIVVNVVNNWIAMPDAKLVFMIRLFLPSIWGFEPVEQVNVRLGKPPSFPLSTETYITSAIVTDVGMIRLQYLQAVYHIITGHLASTEVQALRLGAIHFLIRFGSFETKSHIEGFLGNRIVEFIPVRHLKKGTKSMSQWEVSLLDAARNLAQEYNMVDIKAAKAAAAANSPDGEEESSEDVVVPVFLYRLYVAEIFTMELYGCTFFRCQQKATRFAPENPILAIHHLGVFVCDKSRVVQKRYHLTEIQRWGFKPNVMFTLELKISPTDGEGNGAMEFQTAESQTMANLLTDYALAYCSEEEKRQDRIAELEVSEAMSRLNPPPVPSTSSSSGKAPPPPPPRPFGATVATIRAVVKIQALYRGYALRRDWIREDAAILIQSTYRGFCGRKLVSSMIEKMIANGELQLEK